MQAALALDSTISARRKYFSSAERFSFRLGKSAMAVVGDIFV
jgi:hypothetical protein